MIRVIGIGFKEIYGVIGCVILGGVQIHFFADEMQKTEIGCQRRCIRHCHERALMGENGLRTEVSCNEQQTSAEQQFDVFHGFGIWG